MTRFWKQLLLVGIVLSGCSKNSGENIIPENVLQISVVRGSVSLNGTPVGMEALESALQDAEATGMQVWYYRDNPAAQPSSEAFEVFKRIVSHNVPVSLSSRPDFSDYIDEHGNSRPRDAE